VKLGVLTETVCSGGYTIGERVDGESDQSEIWGWHFDDHENWPFYAK
jgi:hypothetical protein